MSNVVPFSVPTDAHLTACTVCKQHTMYIYKEGNKTRYYCDNGCSEMAIKSAHDKTPRKKATLGWLNAFKLTEDEVNELVDPEWIYKDLIIKGHLIVIPADPGAGKTTIMLHVAGEIAGNYEVVYVNADVGSGDVKVMQHQADRKGFSLLLPDMKAGLSIMDVVNRLIEMNDDSMDYSGFVFIFDTFKKMVDVINKGKSKELFNTLRGLTAKGVTIVLLAHCNKYPDEDGHPIYEGVGDTRSDCDDLIYLIPKKNEDGSMTVSTDPLHPTAKRRGNHQPITFNLTAEREVSRADVYVDTQSQVADARQRQKDETIIDAINESIRAGSYRRTEIVGWCQERRIAGRRAVEGVLDRHEGKLWTCQRGFQNNTHIYMLIQ